MDHFVFVHNHHIRKQGTSYKKGTKKKKKIQDFFGPITHTYFQKVLLEGLIHTGIFKSTPVQCLYIHSHQWDAAAAWIQPLSPNLIASILAWLLNWEQQPCACCHHIPNETLKKKKHHSSIEKVATIVQIQSEKHNQQMENHLLKRSFRILLKDQPTSTPTNSVGIYRYPKPNDH